VPGPLLAPRSAYLAQVRQIDPPVLVDREAELAELAGFCLDGQASSYVWWQAGPWAGKSALLSTFVLHPPAAVRSRVQVLAFFITARLAAQDTRQAFTTVVGEQLAGLTGQQVSAVIDESLREAWLLDLLAQAAYGCQQQGVRLVLLVDGLDEDRGSPPARTRAVSARCCPVPRRPGCGSSWPAGPTRPCLTTCPTGIRCAIRGSSGRSPTPRTPVTCNGSGRPS
jgi:hypothetical protein